jgi:hypothetical protein
VASTSSALMTWRSSRPWRAANGRSAASATPACGASCPHYSAPPQVSRLLKRLHVHGLIKKIGHTDKYYLTHAGQRVVLTALTRRELVVIPSLAGLLSAAA